MKANIIRGGNGKDYLTFTIQGFDSPIQIPVITSGNRDKTGCWTWNRDLEKPTLKPSVRTRYYNGKEMTEIHY